MKKKKKNSKKNYVVLGLIYAGVIILVLYLASWYDAYKDYQKQVPVLEDVVPFVNPLELDHYLTENPSPILYLCTASNGDCRDFEGNIKKALEENEYQDLIYVNLESIDDVDNYVLELLEKYEGNDFVIDRVPCLIKFTDLKITNVEDGLNGALLTKDEALNFLDANDTSKNEE